MGESRVKVKGCVKARALDIPANRAEKFVQLVIGKIIQVSAFTFFIFHRGNNSFIIVKEQPHYCEKVKYN